MREGLPSLKAARLLAILAREPLNYRIVRQAGSHRRLEADGRPPLMFAFHERATLAPAVAIEHFVPADTVLTA